MDPEDVDQRIGAYVYRVLDLGAIGHAVASVFTDQVLEAFRQQAGVRYVEPDETWHLLQQTPPWGIGRVDTDVAHANGETGNGADIVIIDTGIDDDHPDPHFIKISAIKDGGLWSDVATGIEYTAD